VARAFGFLCAPARTFADVSPSKSFGSAILGA
jgi:hypothetical protein